MGQRNRHSALQVEAVQITRPGTSKNQSKSTHKARGDSNSNSNSSSNSSSNSNSNSTSNSNSDNSNSANSNSDSLESERIVMGAGVPAKSLTEQSRSGSNQEVSDAEAEQARWAAAEYGRWQREIPTDSVAE